MAQFNISAQRFHQLDYDKCTDEELRQFLEAKTGEKDSEKSVSRNALIKRLRECDANATFRFGDLAPELRLVVYENLALHPQILATCKKCHDEAKKALSTVVLPKIGVSDQGLVLTSPTRASAITQLGRPSRAHEWCAVSEFDVAKMISLLGDLRTEVSLSSQMILEIIIAGSAGFEGSMINIMLYLLATLFNGGAQRIEMQVNIKVRNRVVGPRDEPLEVPSAGLMHTLAPLTMMGPGVFLTFGNCFGVEIALELSARQ